ncbi:MAG TPA: hypothetical protein VGR02_06180 [Thermoanaerobaculia bacterium]|nr:hypothetical protein [Thermoanaerobaculia bacterium]
MRIAKPHLPCAFFAAHQGGRTGDLLRPELVEPQQPKIRLAVSEAHVGHL